MTSRASSASGGSPWISISVPCTRNLTPNVRCAIFRCSSWLPRSSRNSRGSLNAKWGTASMLSMVP